MKRLASCGTSGEDALDDAARDVGQTEVTAIVAVSQLGVIEAEQAQNGGVEIVDVDGILDSRGAEFVGGAKNRAAFDAAAGQP
jgi:hypothetical protein